MQTTPAGTEIMAEEKPWLVAPLLAGLYGGAVGETSSSAHRTK